MRRGYAQHDAAGWVRANTKRDLSPLGRQVAEVLSVVGGGIYNAPINAARVNWYDQEWGVEVTWRGSMANWDSCALSVLVIECHRRMLRVEIEPCNMQHLKLTFHQRKSREGGMGERLPELREVEKIVDGWHGDMPEKGQR